jgi:uncharacterized Zn finger protein (UPF0148 family)
VPEDDWYCPTCAEKKQEEADAKSAQPTTTTDAMQVEETAAESTDTAQQETKEPARPEGIAVSTTETVQTAGASDSIASMANGMENVANNVFTEAIEAINGTKGEDLLVDVVSLDGVAPQLLSSMQQPTVEATDETIAVLQQTSEAILKTHDSLLEQALHNIDEIVANVMNESLQFHSIEMVAEEQSDVNSVEKHANVTNLVAKEQ